MTEKLNKTELKKLRDQLSNEDLAQVANDTGLKFSSVKQILLKPERFNKKVLKKAIELALENSAEIIEMKAQVKAIS